MTSTLIFGPLLPWPIIATFAGVVVAGVILALWKGLLGWARVFTRFNSPVYLPRQVKKARDGLGSIQVVVHRVEKPIPKGLGIQRLTGGFVLGSGWP